MSEYKLQFGDTFLIHAVKAGHEEIAEALLHKQTDIDARGVVSVHPYG